MNKILFSIAFVTSFFTNLLTQTIDSVNMTSNYALDVFYSLENSTIQSLSNSEWTVAFSTGAQTASIYINDGREVELYKTNASFSNFTTFGVSDTIGLSTWNKVHNEYTSWELSAFENGTTGHPNYGWGNYNTVTHTVVGEKIFLLKTLEENYYKVQVIKKESGAWHYRYATLDNSFDTTIVYQASDLFDRNFAYLNMDNHTILNREPVNTTWDLLFTKYYDSNINDTTAGVLLNKGVQVLQVDGVANSSATHTGGTFDNTINHIGTDWKIYNSGSSSFSIVSDRTYFIKNEQGDIYKLYFTRFDGSATGKIVFSKQLISSGASSIQGNKNISFTTIYPNPTANNATILINNAINESQITIDIYSVDGKQIYTKAYSIQNGKNKLSLNLSEASNGLYFVQLYTKEESQTFYITIKK